MAMTHNAIPHGDTEAGSFGSRRGRHRASCLEGEVTPERRLSDFDSDPSVGYGSPDGRSEISMESLILAQDERWRHA